MSHPPTKVLLRGQPLRVLKEPEKALAGGFCKW